MSEENTISRRSAFAAGAAALLLAGFAGEAKAEMSAAEKANIKVVDDFLAIWAKPDTDVAKALTFFTDDCVVRMSEHKPALTGKTALGQGFADLLKTGRYGIKSLSTFARGPVVANDRVDWKIEDGGKRGAEFPIAGVFVVRNGKIAEWSDYLAKA